MRAAFMRNRGPRDSSPKASVPVDCLLKRRAYPHDLSEESVDQIECGMSALVFRKPRIVDRIHHPSGAGEIRNGSQHADRDDAGGPTATSLPAVAHRVLLRIVCNDQLWTEPAAPSERRAFGRNLIRRQKSWATRDIEIAQVSPKITKRRSQKTIRIAASVPSMATNTAAVAIRMAFISGFANWWPNV